MYFRLSIEYKHLISRLIETMETLNYGDQVGLWKLRDDPRKLHIGYGVCLDSSTLSIYGAQEQEECIIFSLEIVFLLYQQWALFNPILTLQNCGSIIGKNCF
jgi:hypothetical protein